MNQTRRRLSIAMAAFIAATGIVGAASIAGTLSGAPSGKRAAMAAGEAGDAAQGRIEGASGPSRVTSAAPLLDGRAEAAFQAGFEKAVPFRKAAVAALAAARYDLFNEGFRGVLVGDDGWLFSSEEFEADLGFLDEDFGAKAARVRDELAAKGIALIVAVVPSKARIMAGRLGRYRVRERLEGRYAYLQNELNALSIPAADLASALAASEAAGREPFLKTDTHWSPEGAQAAAEAVARVVLATVPDLELASVSTESAGVSDRDGDLLSFLPARGASRRPLPPPDRVERFETFADTGAGLFGSQSIPVALVGTSYSAEPAFHFDGFLKRALGADVLNLSAKGEGPYAPMERALSGTALEDSGVRAVIWEIPERYAPSGDIIGG